MSIAGRKGKFSLSQDSESPQDAAWKRWEDVLTADVFGAYRYLPLKYGLIPFLTHAQDENGRTLEDFLDAQGVSLKGLDYARIHFWPHFDDRSEPDLMLLLGTAPDRIQVALVTEVKFGAPQHEMTYEGVTRSQISHYMIQHLLGTYASPIRSSEIPGVRPLLYITSDRELPDQQIKRARSEVMQANPELSAAQLGIFWCSWIAAGKEARRLWKKHRHDVGEKPWLRLLYDLWQDLEHRGLMPKKPFRRIPQPADFQPAWHYVPRVEIAPPSFSLPSVVYRERKLALDTFGKLPEIIYAKRSIGIPAWPREKKLESLLYQRERENER